MIKNVEKAIHKWLKFPKIVYFGLKCIMQCWFFTIFIQIVCISDIYDKKSVLKNPKLVIEIIGYNSKYSQTDLKLAKMSNIRHITQKQ